MNWLHYLAEANLYLCIFYAGYRLLLQRETFYQLSRIYLLFTATVSFIIPLVQIGILKPAVVYGEVIVLHRHIAATGDTASTGFDWQQAIVVTYLLGVLLGSVLLVTKLISLYKLSRKSLGVRDGGCNLVRVGELNSAFSFFNYLFIGEAMAGEETVIRHEMVHIRQKHSADIIFVELLKIVCWFNPVIYLLQNSLKALHEYIADAETAGSPGNALHYAEFLVGQAYGAAAPSLTHSFFNKNLLKDRIMKLHQKPSGKLAKVKYLVLLPLCAGLLCVSTLAFSKSYGWIDMAPRQSEVIQTKLRQTATGDTNQHQSYLNARYRNSDVTSTGYHYRESGYLIKGKTNFRVIIISKDGNEKAWFKNSCSAADLKMLKDKYGYTFPDMELFNRMPPPPPEPLRPGQVKKLPPPPPPIPPRRSHIRKHKMLAPPVSDHTKPAKPSPPPPIPPVKRDSI